MARRIGKGTQANRVAKLIAGTTKYFPEGTQQLMAGSPLTVDDVVGELQELVDNRRAVVAAQALVMTKLAIERAREPALLAIAASCEAFVRLAFGGSPEVLADFGLAPRKQRTPQTAEEKAITVAKRNATRKARHTMGPRQKEDIHGHVEAHLVVTPAPEPRPEPGDHS